MKDTTAIQAQEAILCLLLNYPEEVDDVAEKIRVDWFDGERRTAVEQLVKGDCDAVSLTQHGIKAETAVRWMEMLAERWSLNRHIDTLDRSFVSKQLNLLANQIKTSDNDTALRMIDEFSQRISAIEKCEPLSSMDGVRRLANELQRRSEVKGLLGMSYGLEDLDAKTEGLHKGDLVVVAAPSSMGKTAFACGVVESAAKAGHRALVFSCEMTTEQLLMRSLSSASKVPLSRIRAARFGEADWPRMTSAFGEMSQWPMWFDDTAGVTLAEVVRKVKRYKKKHGIELVMIDYLQIMGYDKDAELRELDRITTGLKNLAKSEDVCVILLSQLNRSGQKENRKPQMTDLRGSGMIENNSDVILFPWRPAALCEKCLEGTVTPDHDPDTHKREAYILIGKQRQGERNVSVPVLWREEVTRFENLARGYD